MTSAGDRQPRQASCAELPRAVDAVVIGGGHAGIEAAWALARLGRQVALVTFDPSGLARMSCNPSIGGLAKGQLVREIDALGGLMGRLIDRTGIHYRMLNRRKGPAVQAPRAQADKLAYSAEARRVLAALPRLIFVEAEVTEIVVESPVEASRPRVAGVRLAPPDWDAVRPGGAHSDAPAHRSSQPSAGDAESPDAPGRVVRLEGTADLPARAVVIAAGTFLRARLFTGPDPRPGGRRGEPPAQGLSGCLERLGLKLGRLKTGTPPRLLASSVDLSRLDEQPGDEPPPRFSFFEDAPVRNRVLCHLTRTTEETHAVIRGALDRSPLFGGMIQGIGPRYCPSIEDKVVRFPDRGSHHIFLEPEGLYSETLYPNGISTSLPLDVQERYVRTIPGLEMAEIIHPGYAVEYDFLLTTQIDAQLRVRDIEGLYAAGQINGTSGYEEAAAQGLMAGLNANAHLSGREPVTLQRNEAYIGVLLDDLVTKVPTEPYRMFTSQSEYRLLLRQDNADRRLAEIGHGAGLLSTAGMKRVRERWDRIAAERSLLRTARLTRAALQRAQHRASDPATTADAGVLDESQVGRTLAELLKRPGVDFETLKRLGHRCALPEDDRRTLEAEIKYDGYIRKQQREIDRSQLIERQSIPLDLLADPPQELSREARERLSVHRPGTLGQALRIQGITLNDIMILAVRMRMGRT